MGTKPTLPGELDAKLAAILTRELAERRMSQAELARKAGLSQPTVHRMLAAARPMTVDDLDEMCGVLDLVTWKVVREAEEGLSGLRVVPDSSGPADIVPDEGLLAADTSEEEPEQ